VRLLLATFLLVGGCAVLNQKTVKEESPLGPAEIRSAQAAAGAIAVGKSTKADVRKALGEAVVVDFNTGYEVWIYRERPSKELVLLFDPSGTLTKTRIR
jgi:hypothetical protein